MKRLIGMAAAALLVSMGAGAQQATEPLQTFAFRVLNADGIAPQSAATADKLKAQLAMAESQSPADPAAIQDLRTKLEKLVSESQVMVNVSPKMLSSAVTGAPYSADEVTEFNQTLADGTKIHTEDKITVYRDGAGRVRRETPDSVTITDPVAGVSYSVNPKNQTARAMAVFTPRPAMIKTGPVGETSRSTFVYTTTAPAENGAGAMEVQKRAVAIAGAARDEAQAGAAGGWKVATTTTETAADSGGMMAVTKIARVPSKAKSEALGMQTMEGVVAEGTRNVETIDVGAIGNDRPIQVVNERWYSDQLKTTVMTKRTDPRTGEETFRLTNVRLGEPDPSLFQVPAGYKMSGLERKM